MSPTTRTIIAVILTIIIPGVGHMFVGRVKRGVVVLLLGFGGLVAVAFIIPFPYSLPFTIIIYIVVIWDLFRIKPKDVACQKCGNMNTEGSSFCAKCGTALKVNGEVICQKCASKNITGSAFCLKCGSSLD